MMNFMTLNVHRRTQLRKMLLWLIKSWHLV